MIYYECIASVIFYGKSFFNFKQGYKVSEHQNLFLFLIFIYCFGSTIFFFLSNGICIRY
ncbi:hypothetical protein GAMM_350029 [Gammaproteobacteria bacterium]